MCRRVGVFFLRGVDIAPRLVPKIGKEPMTWSRLPLLTSVLESRCCLAAQTGAAVPDGVAEAARGTALAREGKYDLAIEHYKAALRLNPHLPGLQLNLGLAYFKSNHLREAAAAFEEAVRADSGNFQARALLGMSYYGVRPLPGRRGAVETRFRGATGQRGAPLHPGAELLMVGTVSRSLT